MKEISITAPGFTLIELMVLLAVVSILMLIGVPGMESLYTRNELSAAINTYSADHRLARSEAVSRGRQVTLCARNATDVACSTETDWEDGWIVFVNIDRDSPPVIDAGEPVLKVIQPLHAKFSLRSSGDTATHFTYLPTGDARYPGSIILCKHGKTSQSRLLEVSVIGRVNIAELSANDISMTADGNEIESCNP
ncbi:MAG: prepilin-type N-terminal cleavage/methylation domain-containing protein [Granulosicoccus sp.]|nr:prepilin-type N-terminal cleavage/methylation domain-containing protein [Granulosicoccus sp.]